MSVGDINCLKIDGETNHSSLASFFNGLHADCEFNLFIHDEPSYHVSVMHFLLCPLYLET